MIARLAPTGSRVLGQPRTGRRAAPPARRLRAALALVLLVPQLTGCFTYVPVSVGASPNGVEVSLRLNDPGRVALAEPIGPGIRRLDGQVVAQTDTTLLLAVSSVQFYDLHIPMRLEDQRLEIGREHIAELREKRLSRSRTAVVAGLVAVGAVAVSMIAIAGFGTDSPGGPRDGPGNGEQQ